MSFEEIQELTKDMHNLNTKEERKAFYEYTQKVPDGGTILDIGTCAGGSAFVFALSSLPKVKVITVDPVRNKSFFENRKILGQQGKVIYKKMTSEALAKEWSKPISLMFVDGVHSGGGVRDDFNNFYPYLEVGGVVMFHDYFLYDGIRIAVDEILASGKVKKLDLVDSQYSPEVRTGLVIVEKL